MNDDIPYSKKDQRKLSPFLGHELLYDYLSRKLDPERMKAMDEVVQENRDIQDEIQNLNSALNYVEHLAESEISTSLIEQVRQPTSYVQGLLQKIKFPEWPHGLKLGLEVLIVTSILAAGAVFLPWHRLTKMNWGQAPEVVLTEVKKEFKKSEQSDEDVAPKQSQAEVNAATSFQDEHISKDATPAPTSTPSIAPAATPVAVVQETKAKPTPKPTPVPVKTTEVAAENGADAAAAKKQGWLYRGTISVVNLDTTKEKFVAQIAEFGGRKAGEVELGWKKSDGAYFHFTIPEAKYEELNKYLSEYGTLKIQKEKHERVMPDGIIRIIISVTESQKKGP